MKYAIIISMIIWLINTTAVATNHNSEQKYKAHNYHKQPAISHLNDLNSMKVEFSFDNGCAGDSIRFINTSEISGDSFLNFMWKFGDGSASIIKTNPSHVYQKSGIFQVCLIAMTFGGLKDSVLHSITIYEVPPPPTITRNGNSLISSSPSGNHWYDSNGSIPGATWQSFIPAKKGYYWVKVTNSNGCESVASNLIFINPLNINDAEKLMAVSVFPNPATNVIKIVFSYSQTLKMQVYNTVGECILQTELNRLTNEIDISSLNKGIYIIKLTSQNGSAEKKLVKD